MFQSTSRCGSSGFGGTNKYSIGSGHYVSESLPSVSLSQHPGESQYYSESIQAVEALKSALAQSETTLREIQPENALRAALGKSLSAENTSRKFPSETTLREIQPENALRATLGKSLFAENTSRRFPSVSSTYRPESSFPSLRESALISENGLPSTSRSMCQSEEAISQPILRSDEQSRLLKLSQTSFSEGRPVEDISREISSTIDTTTSRDISKVVFNAMTQQTKNNYSIDDFEIIRKLGQGHFGETFAVKNKRDGTTVVIKRISKYRVERKSVQSEVSILSKLSSICESYILCYKGFFEDQYYYYIITEFLGEYITLKDYISRMEKGTKGTKEDLQNIVKNLLLGLREIHEKSVAHRDIKPDNILVNPQTNQIKYIDFGLSCDVESCPHQGLAGTMSYLPPEAALQVIVPGLVNYQKADIWSLGMTVFELIAKKPLFQIYLEERKDSSTDLPLILREFYCDYKRFYDFLVKQLTNILPEKNITSVIYDSLFYPPMQRDLDKAIRDISQI